MEQTYPQPSMHFGQMGLPHMWQTSNAGSAQCRAHWMVARPGSAAAGAPSAAGPGAASAPRLIFKPDDAGGAGAAGADDATAVGRATALTTAFAAGAGASVE